MKKSIVAICALIMCMSCVNKVKTEEKESAYASFGDSISADDALSKEEMFAKYAGINPGDTLNVKFKSNINSVCQKKGCWMILDLAGDEKAFIKFKDYAFFMPLNAKNEEVIVKGKAFVSVESCEELRHYAKDAGKSLAAIDSITEPKTTYGFTADGVLMKK